MISTIYKYIYIYIYIYMYVCISKVGQESTSDNHSLN